MTTTSCIQWPQSLGSNGYGQTFFRGKVTKAHRAVWIEANGEIPEGMVLDHICHGEAVSRGECEGGVTCPHRACVNLEHLRLITQRENILAGLQSIDNRSHCRQGHPFIKENIMVRKDGTRECSECNRIRARKVWANRKVG